MTAAKFADRFLWQWKELGLRFLGPDRPALVRTLTARAERVLCGDEPDTAATEWIDEDTRGMLACEYRTVQPALAEALAVFRNARVVASGGKRKGRQ